MHANLGRFFYLEWRFPLGTYHLSKVLAKRWLEWGCCLKQDSDISYHIISYHIISYHIISYRIVSYRIISYHIISYHIISYHQYNIDIEDQFEASTFSHIPMPDSSFFCVFAVHKMIGFNALQQLILWNLRAFGHR